MKKETKFTPGPWNVDPEHPVDIESAEGPVCLAVTNEDAGATYKIPHNAVNIEQCIANGHLIAAAPELYAALEHALGLLNDWRAHGPVGGPALAKALSLYKNAIARARGEKTPSE